MTMVDNLPSNYHYDGSGPATRPESEILCTPRKAKRSTTRDINNRTRTHAHAQRNVRSSGVTSWSTCALRCVSLILVKRDATSARQRHLKARPSCARMRSNIVHTHHYSLLNAKTSAEHAPRPSSHARPASTVGALAHAQTATQTSTCRKPLRATIKGIINTDALRRQRRETTERNMCVGRLTPAIAMQHARPTVHECDLEIGKKTPATCIVSRKCTITKQNRVK